jgi:hypothetical protein
LNGTCQASATCPRSCQADADCAQCTNGRTKCRNFPFGNVCAP